MTKFLGLVLVIPMFVGCGTDSGPEVLPALTVPPVPAADKGWQIITPIVEDIKPSTDEEICTWTDIIADKETDVRSTLGYQTEPPGHHVILFYTTERQPPNTQRVCNDSDMATFRFLSGAGSQGEINEAPGDLVFRLPAGAQLVVNHHYLNTTDKVMRGQSAINVNFADKGKTYTPAGYLAITNTSLVVDQGDTTQQLHAVLDRPYKVWQLIPHMHQWGKHTIVTTTHNGELKKQFDLDWDPAYAFHPPQNDFDPATPFMLEPGDSIDVSCEWNNDAGRQLAFGFEMCVAFANTVNDNGESNWAWDNGAWTVF